MAYEKIGFKKGDVLKAEHLNHIEEALLNLMPQLTPVYTNDIPTTEDLFLNPSRYYIRGSMDTNLEGKSFYFNRTLSSDNFFYYTAFDSNYINLIIIIDASTKTYEVQANTALLTTVIINPGIANIWENSAFTDFSDYDKLFFFASNTSLSIGDPSSNVTGLLAIHCSMNFPTDQNFNDFYATYLTFFPMEQAFMGGEDFLNNLSSLRNSLTLIKVYFDGSWTVEPLSDYIISINNITNTVLQEALVALQKGRSVYLSLDSENFPGYKIPLVWVDEDDGKAWFSTEMIAKEENSIFSLTLLIAITTNGVVERYIKNPDTGELILQE